MGSDISFDIPGGRGVLPTRGGGPGRSLFKDYQDIMVPVIGILKYLSYSRSYKFLMNGLPYLNPLRTIRIYPNLRFLGFWKMPGTSSLVTGCMSFSRQELDFLGNPNRVVVPWARRI